MKIQILLLVFTIIFTINGISQSYYYWIDPDYNPIDHTASFLIEPMDAKAAAIGEAGAATTPDAASSFWNPAKYAFIDVQSFNVNKNDSLIPKDLGFLFSYKPIIPNLIDNANQFYFSAYKRIDGKQTLATSFNYYSGSEFTLTNQYGQIIGHFRPVEWATDLTYSRRVSDYWALGASLRYIYSSPYPTNQGIQGVNVKAGHSLAADLGVYYSKPIMIRNIDHSMFSFGTNISNMGSKISYFEYDGNQDEENNFIPTNLRIGTAFSLEKKAHAVEFAFDICKLLVPTHPYYQRDTDGNFVLDADGNPLIEKGMDPNVSMGKGMIQSFYDAPNGFKEEMHELAYAAGIAYCYNDLVAFRTGYHHQHKNKSDRRYFSFGVGLKYSFAEIDLAFYLPTDSIEETKNSPYKKMWMTTLKFNFSTRKQT